MERYKPEAHRACEWGTDADLARECGCIHPHVRDASTYHDAVQPDECRQGLNRRESGLASVMDVEDEIECPQMWMTSSKSTLLSLHDMVDLMLQLELLGER